MSIWLQTFIVLVKMNMARCLYITYLLQKFVDASTCYTNDDYTVLFCGLKIIPVKWYGFTVFWYGQNVFSANTAYCRVCTPKTKIYAKRKIQIAKTKKTLLDCFWANEISTENTLRPLSYTSIMASSTIFNFIISFYLCVWVFLLGLYFD